MNTPRVFAVVVACLALGTPLSALAPKQLQARDLLRVEPSRARVAGVVVEPGQLTSVGAAAGAFVQRYGGEWRFRSDPRTARFVMIQGSGIPLIPGRGNRLGEESLAGLDMPDGTITLGALEPRVHELIEANASLLTPDRGTLVLDGSASALRDDGRLISFWYEWVIDGVPVEDAGVFVRVNSGNVTQIGAPFVGPIGLDVRPALNAEQAIAALLDYTGDGEVARIEDEAELLVQTGDDGLGGIDYRLVWKIVYRIRGQIETWEGRIDAQTGAVAGFRDINHYARAVGGVYPRTVYENNEISVPIGLLDVDVDGGSVTADTAGAYTYSGGNISSGLNGLYFDTNCQGCSSPAQPSVQIAGIGSGRVDFGLGGDDEIGNGQSTAADRNSFFHLNQVRRAAAKWIPTNGFIDQTHFTSNVNINSICNAVYTGSAVNFYRSGGDCNNTGEIADVMYHEYGHGIDQNTNGGDGATGEATADVVSMHMTHSPLIGPGFRTNGNPVRDLDAGIGGLLTAGNLLESCVCGPNQSCGPLGGEVHCEGEIYGQVHWELSQAFVGKHGHHTGWRDLERVFYLSLPDAQGYLPGDAQPVYDAYIQADDDDGNLANGTPNAAEIFTAFDTHEIANAQVPTSTPCTRPAQPTLNVTPQCASFDLSWSAVAGIDHYELFRTELLEDQAYFPIGTVAAGQTTFTDSEVAPGVDYWYVVAAVTAAGCESTVENPVAASLPAQPILALSAASSDDEPMGNRSGFADPGEEVDVELTLTNFGQLGASSISGTLSSTIPGVTIVLDSSNFDDLGPGQSAENLDVLRFTTDDQQLACGDVLDFRFEPAGASGCAAETSYFNVTLGESALEHFDDFENDLGWQHDAASSTASTGAWTRGDPIATSTQPEDDVTPGGTNCWFTAQNPGGGAGTDDVDDGVVTLLSPLFDLSSQTDLTVSYYRWFGMSEPGTDSGDFFRADVSDDGGQSWVNLETLDFNSPAPAWVRRSFTLADFVALTDQVQFRFQAADGIADGSLVEAAIDEFSLERLVCDDTPACFLEPTFDGLASAAAGGCGEIDLAWQPATSNCVNAEITYNVYRSTTPGFTPGPANLAASAVTSTNITDVLLDPGQIYYYVVRAFDSRSGEESNSVERSAIAPETPDDAAPQFAGLESALSGGGCGETILSWSAALETCNSPVAYDVFRSTDPGFVPAPGNQIGTTFATSLVDAGLAPGVAYTYVVRARDAAGNVDGNEARVTVQATVLDFTVFETAFEPDDAGWTVIPPNDAAAGNWQWGDPVATSYQPADDASPNGVNCWITGLASGPGNDDVDDGTTTLLSAQYDMASATNPVVRYQRWFTNDQGGSPGDATDNFKIDVSNDDGQNWTALEDIGAGTPLAWVPVELPLPIAATNQMRFRFQAADLGAGSLVEAGVDEFELLDAGAGCIQGCGAPPPGICSIHVNRSGNDIEVTWSGDPGQRVLVYAIAGCGEQLLLGTVEGGTSFLHQGAAASSEPFGYRVTTVDSCGVEQPICGTTDCP